MTDSPVEVQELGARSWVIHYADDNGNPAQGLNAIVSGPRVLPAGPVVEVVPLSVAEKLAVALDDVINHWVLSDAPEQAVIDRAVEALDDHRDAYPVPAGGHREEGQP